MGSLNLDLGAYERLAAALAEPDDEAGEPGPAADDLQAIRVDGHRLEVLIGEGSHGIVFRAIEISTGDRVALKVLRVRGTTGNAVRRFRQEAEVLRSLRHPSIVAWRGQGVARIGAHEHLYISMEWVEGSDFAEWCQEPGRTLNEKVEMVARLAEALSAAHRKGVIHRDLKPANVRIDGEGSLRILDFGGAWVSDVEMRVSGIHTHPDSIVGTLAYMCPEQLGAGEATVDTRFDVYSMGVMLYEAVAGCLPIDVDGAGFLQAAERVRRNDPPRLGSKVGEARGDLEAIVTKALLKDPSQRHQSADALARDLRSLLTGESLGVRGEAFRRDLGLLWRRHRLKAASLVGMVIFLAVIVFFSIEATKQAAWRVEQAQRDLRFVVSMAESMADSGAATAVRQELMSILEVALEDAAVVGIDDGVTAAALEAVSDVCASSSSHQAALGLRERALERRKRIGSDSIEARRLLSRLETKIGDSLGAMGRTGEQIEWYRVVRDRDGDLCRENPQDPSLLNDYFYSVLRLQTALDPAASAAGASSDLFEELEELADRIEGIGRNSLADMRAVATAHIRRFEMLSRFHDEPEVRKRLESLGKALSIATELRVAYPEDAAAERMWLNALISGCIEESRFGDPGSARRHLDRAADGAEAMLRRDPDSIDGLRLRSRALDARLKLELESGDRGAVGEIGLRLLDADTEVCRHAARSADDEILLLLHALLPLERAWLDGDAATAGRMSLTILLTCRRAPDLAVAVDPAYVKELARFLSADRDLASLEASLERMRVVTDRAGFVHSNHWRLRADIEASLGRPSEAAESRRHADASSAAMQAELQREVETRRSILASSPFRLD